jgi:hypothetical protein
LHKTFNINTLTAKKKLCSKDILKYDSIEIQPNSWSFFMKKIACLLCIVSALLFQTNSFAETSGGVTKTSSENASKASAWGIGLCALVVIAGMAAVIAAYSSSSPAGTSHAHD